MQISESVGGVLCLQLEPGRNSLLEPAEEAVLGGANSSTFGKKEGKERNSYIFSSGFMSSAKKTHTHMKRHTVKELC